MSFVQSGESKIYYEVYGEGPALVFCHGAGSNGATWWQQIATFSRRYRCIVVDSRCFGRSAYSLDMFKPAEFPGDLAAVLDAAGVECASLVCQSLGGITGLRFALQYPERVQALVLCDSPLSIRHPGLLADVKRHTAQAAGDVENRALAPDFVRDKPELAVLYRMINQFNRHIFDPQDGRQWADCVAALFDEDFLLDVDALGALRCPTLFVVGGLDPAVRPAHVREVAARVGGAQVVVIDGAGHSPYFERALEFNRCVADFLDGCRGA